MRSKKKISNIISTIGIYGYSDIINVKGNIKNDKSVKLVRSLKVE